MQTTRNGERLGKRKTVRSRSRYEIERITEIIIKNYDRLLLFLFLTAHDGP
jgi:hypothetical protein